jgi:hypothetical protein
MLYRGIIAVCSQIHTKHIITLCGQNVEFFGAFAKLRKATIVIVMCQSVRPHVTTRLPLVGFSWNSVIEYFSKLCRENSMFINIGQELALYVKTDVHFLIISLSVLLRMRNVSDKRCTENQNTHLRVACWIPKATNTHSQYVILIAFPLQQRLHERAWMLPYTYIDYLVEC